MNVVTVTALLSFSETTEFGCQVTIVQAQVSQFLPGAELSGHPTCQPYRYKRNKASASSEGIPFSM